MIRRFRTVMSIARAVGPVQCVRHYLALVRKVEVASTTRLFGRPFAFRLGSVDPYVLAEVLAHKTYDIPLSYSPAVIVDAGAHIGVPALYFRQRWPNARLICIEPSMMNWELLSRNLQSEAVYVTVLQRALWSSNTGLPLRDRGTGNWGFSLVSGSQQSDERIVKTITMEEIISAFCDNHVDLFKCDIEGSEREVFSRSAEWIGRVSVVAIELHDRFEPGCREAVLSACADFPERLWLGRTLVLGRKGTLSGAANRC